MAILYRVARRVRLALFLLTPAVALAAPFAYITNTGSASVSVVDTATNTVVATVPVGLGALGVEVNSTGSRAYVANSVVNTVSVINTATNTVIATAAAGASPIGVAVNPSGTRVYVTNIDSANVTVIDTTINTVVATIAVGTSPAAIVMNPAGTRVYVGNSDSNSISIIDAATNSVVATVATNGDPEGLAINPAGTRLYVTIDSSNSVLVIDTATNTVVGTVGVGLTPTGVAVNSAGTRAYVTNSDSNTVSVIDIATNTVVATIAVGTSPIGIAVTPSGNRAYVANNGSNDVSVIDTTSNAVVGTIAVGTLPSAFGRFIGPNAVPASNYQGLWWNSAESGWGINLAHQGDQIYLTWYTYDGTGKASWLAMLASKVAPNTYSGAILEVHGSPYNTAYNPAAKVPSTVGSGTLSFTSPTTGAFSFTAKNVSRTVSITKFSLGGPVPTCTYEATPSLTGATNYQDLWWGGPSQDGWGINLTHEGSLIYATWYTYDTDGSPLWLASLMNAAGPGLYTGSLMRAQGPAFGSAFDPAAVSLSTVGTASLVIVNGNIAVWNYSIGTLSSAKSLTRFLFAAPAATVCR